MSEITASLSAVFPVIRFPHLKHVGGIKVNIAK